MAKTAWAKLIEVVKQSDMSEAMKVACLAQAILESGRGTSNVSKICLNFWGMKFRDELKELAEPVDVRVTSEDSGSDTFAGFKCVHDAVYGWRVFLTRPYYAGWEQHKDDAKAFIEHISPAWCPADGYAAKVIALFDEAKAYLGGSRVTIPRWLLDPGHSSGRVGARSNDGTAKEEVLNLLQAEHIARLLVGKIDCNIFNPVVDNLEQIGAKAENFDGFVSLHHNKYGGDGDPGIEVFCANRAKEDSVSFAKAVAAEISLALNAQNRGVKFVDYTVIKVAEFLCKGPVCLVESYFLNPYSEETAKKRSLVAADAIAKVMSEWVK